MGDESTQKSRYALGRVAADVAIVVTAFASTSLIAGTASSSVEATRLALSGGLFAGLTLENEIHILRRDEPAEFASAVVELLSDRARMSKLGSAARSWVESNYTWQRAMAALEGVYRELTLPPVGVGSGDEG
jgi:glycosyltransferase involved in cell wall biosynthesis